jgi:hypothetical protein
MSEQLAEMKCTACRSDEPTLSDEEIEKLQRVSVIMTPLA